MDVRADDFVRLAKALKQAPKDLQREFAKGVNRAVRPLKADIKQSAEDVLPHRGGLASEVAGMRLSTRRNKNGLRLVGKGRYSLYHLNRGQVRHPVKGGAPTIQRIPPGFWDKPAEAALPEVRRELGAAMDEVAKKIDRAV